jgi:hypothetical protein
LPRAALRFEHDNQGRLVRVFLPGSPTPLAYEWDRDACTIAPLGGPALLTITPAGAAMRVALAETGGGWDETPPLLGAQTITIRDRADRKRAVCRITVDTLQRPTSRQWTAVDNRASCRFDAWRRDDKGRLSAWTHGTGTQRIVTTPQAISSPNAGTRSGCADRRRPSRDRVVQPDATTSVSLRRCGTPHRADRERRDHDLSTTHSGR